jgi:hypothetical protein
VLSGEAKNTNFIVVCLYEENDSLIVLLVDNQYQFRRGRLSLNGPLYFILLFIGKSNHPTPYNKVHNECNGKIYKRLCDLMVFSAYSGFFHQ